jgi:hypothetical protein
MRMRAWLAALGLTAVAAGCIGSGSAAHAPLTGAQALHEAKADGFTGVTHRYIVVSWRCEAHSIQQGPPKPTGRYANYQRATYVVRFGDRRVPPTSDDTGRISMVVYVFKTAALPARCARGGMYSDEHRSPPSRYKVIAPGTVELHAPHGIYDTFLAEGDVLGLGLAYNKQDSQIVQADLARIAQQISG